MYNVNEDPELLRPIKHSNKLVPNPATDVTSKSQADEIGAQ